MGKRKETLIPNLREEDEEDEEACEDDSKGFFACYLLCSLCPRFKGQTYIGFTVNPMRRIRQHNGEIKSGAWRTKSKRPWEMILCIYGFPTNVTALQFEWAWQHPMESLAVRKAAASLKSLSGIDGKIKTAYTMLTLPPWQGLKLTVNFFSTKYVKNAVVFKSLPKQMKVKYCPMNELPCYTSCVQTFDDMDDEDEGEDADGANLRHLEEPTNLSVRNISDDHHSSAATVYDRLGQNKNDAVRRSEEPFTQRIEDEPSSLIGANQPKEVRLSEEPFTQRIEDEPFSLIGMNKSEEAYNWTSEDMLPFHLVDSPLTTSSKSTNLVNSVRTVEDRDSLGSIKMSTTTNKCEPSTKQLAATAIPAKDHFLSPELCYEPVDLSTHTNRDYRLLDESPAKIPSPSSSDLVQRIHGKDPIGLTEESRHLQVPKLKQFSGISLPSTKKLHALPEIIDISTPSSNYITRTFRQKKRRNNWVSQEVIDLTKF